MRIACSVSALLLAVVTTASANGDTAIASWPGGSISYSIKHAKTQLEIRTESGARHVVSVRRDSSVAPTAAPTGIEVVGEIKGSAIILVDTYRSVPGGMSYCQAGEERFLRVISLSRKPATETFHLKIASCRDNIELASPGIEWQSDAATLRLHWLLGPAGKGTGEERTYRLGRDGRVTKDSASGVNVPLVVGSILPFRME